MKSNMMKKKNRNSKYPQIMQSNELDFWLDLLSKVHTKDCVDEICGQFS